MRASFCRDRQPPEAVRQVRGRLAHRGGEVVGPPAAARVLRAEARVAADQLVGRLRAPEEVTGRVDADHHRAVDAARVAPGVDHREARAGALADQVDPLVAERPAGGLEVVDLLRQRVAGEIDAVLLEPRGAVAERLRVGAERLLPEEVGGALQRRRDLGAVEPDGAVDAAVADEHDVVVLGEPARHRELHVGAAGTALEAEDRRARMSRARLDAGDRQRDQPRTGPGPVLGDDERAAVGGVAALLRAVVARMQGQLAGLRPGGDGDLVASGGELSGTRARARGSRSARGR